MAQATGTVRSGGVASRVTLATWCVRNFFYYFFESFQGLYLYVRPRAERLEAYYPSERVISRPVLQTFFLTCA